MQRVTIIACLLAVIGCRSEDKPKPPPLPTDGIELVQPGAEPRRPLRYKLPAGGTASLELAMDVDLKTQDIAMKLPTIALAMELHVATVEPDGTAKLEMKVVGAEARGRGTDPDPTLTIMDRQSKLLAGIVVTFGLTPTGKLENTKLEASGRDLSGPMQEQLATLLQAAEQLAMALPDPPVGVGAVWKHRRTMKQNQLTLVTTSLVEIVALDGDTVTFKSTTEMTGADQTLAQGSATMQVTAVRGTGSQTGSFDLAKAIILGESKATLGFEMIAGEQRRPTKLELVTRISPRAP